MQRRQFLQNLSHIGLMSAGMALTHTHSSVWGEAIADNQTPRFLLIFLRGAYDSNHAVIPYASSFYYESRPHIAIAKPGDSIEQALALDANWALHPALRESMGVLYQAKELAFIPFAGTHDASRSHFETQESIEKGRSGIRETKDYLQTTQAGFLQRLVNQVGEHKLNPMSFTHQLPSVLMGETNIPNMSLLSVNTHAHPSAMSQDKRKMQSHRQSTIEQLYAQTHLEKTVKESFATREDVENRLRKSESEMAIKTEKESMMLRDEKANGNSANLITTKGFELEARRVASLMREKYALGFIDIGGWDTHVNQGNEKGVLANKLSELGRGLMAYRQEMGRTWKNTTVVVMSEFGRTFRENGKQGTDHGHGTTFWVLGGHVKGGRMVGEQVEVHAKHLFDNRDMPVLNEYRQILGGLFKSMYDLKSKDAIFSIPPLDLGLL